MSRIRIKKQRTADSRTCDYTKVSKLELRSASEAHRCDVKSIMRIYGEMLDVAGSEHDHDKLSDIQGFFSNFQVGFEKKDWLDRHYKLNRHHLENPHAIPKNVNLIDVLEHIADQVGAGLARSGEVRPVKLSNKLLQQAVKNTIALTLKEVEVYDDE